MENYRRYSIKKVTESKEFLDICDKLKEVEDCELKENRLYVFMSAGEFNKRTMSFVSYDKDRMNGCTVLYLSKDITGDLKLFVIFQWIDSHYPKLWYEYMKFIEGRAKDFKAKKISFTTNRDEKAINRKMGKYGYRKIYNVIEKDIKEVS